MCPPVYRSQMSCKYRAQSSTALPMCKEVDDESPLSAVPINFLCGNVDEQLREFLKQKQTSSTACDEYDADAKSFEFIRTNNMNDTLHEDSRKIRSSSNKATATSPVAFTNKRDTLSKPNSPMHTKASSDRVKDDISVIFTTVSRNFERLLHVWNLDDMCTDFIEMKRKLRRIR